MKMMKHIALYFMMMLATMAATAQNGAWTLFDTRTSDIGGNNIAAIAPDSKGVWVGTYQGLSRLNGGTWTDYSMFNEKLKDQSINCMMTDNRGVWGIPADELANECIVLRLDFAPDVLKDLL